MKLGHVTRKLMRAVAAARPVWTAMGVAVGLVLGAGVAAVANHDASHDTTALDYTRTLFDDRPRRIVYEGSLVLDGAPAEGSLRVDFRLHSGATCTDCEVWHEQQTVQFYEGRFSVGLGDVQALESTLLDADKLYLSIDVEGTALAGRQVIEPVPFAHVMVDSTNWQVDSLADSAPNQPRALPLQARPRIHGADLALGTKWASTNADNDPAQRALVHWLDDKLVFNFGNDFTNGVRMDGSVTVAGKLTAGDVVGPSAAVTNASKLTARYLNLVGTKRTATADGAGDARTIRVNEEWADCGSKPVLAVRLVRLNANTPADVALEVDCAP
jgi:hypothetical protein